LLAVVDTRLAAWVMGARAVDDMLCVCCRFDRDDLQDDVAPSGQNYCTAVMVSMLVESSLRNDRVFTTSMAMERMRELLKRCLCCYVDVDIQGCLLRSTAIASEPCPPLKSNSLNSIRRVFEVVSANPNNSTRVFTCIMPQRAHENRTSLILSHLDATVLIISKRDVRVKLIR
jgi:hypothetical protein